MPLRGRFWNSRSRPRHGRSRSDAASLNTGLAQSTLSNQTVTLELRANMGSLSAWC